MIASEIKCKCGHIVDVKTSPIKVSCHDCGSVLFLDVRSPLAPAHERIRALEEREGKLRAEVGTFIRAVESGRNVNSKGDKDSTVYQQWFGVAYVEYLKRFLASLTPSKPGECEHENNCRYQLGDDHCDHRYEFLG